LGAETNAQDDFLLSNGVGNEFLLIAEPGVILFFIYIHGTPHDDQPVKFAHLGKGIIVEKQCSGKPMAPISRPSRDMGQLFKGYMLEGMNSHVSLFSGSLFEKRITEE
jgi:hypothetical protein